MKKVLLQNIFQSTNCFISRLITKIIKYRHQLQNQETQNTPFYLRHPLLLNILLGGCGWWNRKWEEKSWRCVSEEWLLLLVTSQQTGTTWIHPIYFYIRGPEASCPGEIFEFKLQIEFFVKYFRKIGNRRANVAIYFFVVAKKISFCDHLRSFKVIIGGDYVLPHLAASTITTPAWS